MSEPGTDLAVREWRLIRDEPRDGPTQMALEEVAVETALAENLRTVRVYDWAPSTLSLGYRQAPESVDWDFCEREGIDVTRRQTGGGGIYHDAFGDVSYTIVAPADEVPGNLMDCYGLFCEPILEGLRRLGVDARFASEEQPSIHQPSCYLRDVNPAHDVVVPAAASDAGGSEDGTGTEGGGGEGDDPADAAPKKISGNAQYRRRDAVIQHGSISFDLEPDHHLGVFADHDVSAAAFRERVTAIAEFVDVDRERAVETLADALGEWCDADRPDATWSEDELEAARELADRKYGSEAWVREREVLEAE